jgi:DNA-binding transcriptional regulator GbsR (MarR family)
MSSVQNIEISIKEFIQEWGQLATKWGIPKTMGQIHAMLLISPKPLNADEIMTKLDCSRGSVHTQLQQLLSWGLIYKLSLKEDRKDYFIAEKDMWRLFIKVIDLRRKLELNPMITLVEKTTFESNDSLEAKEFEKVIKDISNFGQRTSKMLEALTKIENFWALNNVARNLEKS